MIKNKEKQHFLVEQINELKNYTIFQRVYRTKYKSKKGLATRTIKSLVCNFQNIGSVGRKPALSRERTLWTDDLINSIKNLVIEGPTFSLNKIAKIVPVSVSTIRNVHRLDLNQKPY